MAIKVQYPRQTVQQGMSFFLPFSLVGDDLLTYYDLSEWTATFEIFDADNVSLHKWRSADSAYVDTGLWDKDGVPVGTSTTTEWSYNGYVEFTKELTAAMVDWGVGHFDFDFIDPFGHGQVRFQGEIVLEEGTTHG